MKRLIFLFVLVFMALSVSAQVSVARKPKPAQATTVKSAAKPSRKSAKSTSKSTSKKRNVTSRCRAKASSASSNKSRIIDNLISNMVYVDGGTFTMGATPEQGNDTKSDENPPHQVTLSSFSIGRYEVTQEEWEAVMGSNPSKFKGAKRPVEMVSWDDCQTFIGKLNAMTGKNFRLPTEAEWEFAARGGNFSRGYKYAGSNDIDSVAVYGDTDGQTFNVGGKMPNELGLYDMTGNVWEWCSDWYDEFYYKKSPQSNPQGGAYGSNRVVRGGWWFVYSSSCRVSHRSLSAPDNRSRNLGLRLAM